MSHVFLVVEENHSFNSVIGSPDMPPERIASTGCFGQAVFC
jgi:hypothetical protein